MFIFWKEKSELNNKVIFNDVFLSHIDYFSELFKLSRDVDNRSNANSIYEIQVALWELLKKVEFSMKNFKKDLVDRWMEHHNDANIFAHKRLIRIARTIIDWVVWRNLWYNRVWLTILSNNKRNLLNDDYEKLLKETGYFSQKFITIISDLTETVRIWDLLFIQDWRVPLITEAKEWKNEWDPLKLFNMITFNKWKKPTKQLDKLLDTQEILNTWSIKRLWLEIYDSDYKLYRYFDEVSKWIDIALKDWYFTWKLNKCMSFQVISIKDFTENDDVKLKSISDKPRKLINASGNLFALSNLDTFKYDNNMFFKWIHPYSVFPFTDDICMKLLTWEIVLTTWINIDWLVSIFNDKWWTVEIVDIDKKNERKIPMKVKSQSWKFWEEAIDDTYFIIRKWEYYQTISSMEFYRILLEFISIKSFIGNCIDIYNKSLVTKEWKWHMINFTKDEGMFN